jgi:hypothetical protein
MAMATGQSKNCPAMLVAAMERTFGQNISRKYQDIRLGKDCNMMKAHRAYVTLGPRAVSIVSLGHREYVRSPGNFLVG